MRAGNITAASKVYPASGEAVVMEPGGAVLDGRDQGTVICPEAEAKLFVTVQIHQWHSSNMA